MARRNYPKRRRSIEDRFDTDVVSLPQHPEIDRLIVVPMKTIYRNTDAAPWAEEVKVIRSFDDDMMHLLSQQGW